MCIVLAAVKISILLFYRRIFVTRNFKWCVDIMIVILLIYGIGSTVVSTQYPKEVAPHSPNTSQLILERVKGANPHRRSCIFRLGHRAHPFPVRLLELRACSRWYQHRSRCDSTVLPYTSHQDPANANATQIECFGYILARYFVCFF